MRHTLAFIFRLVFMAAAICQASRAADCDIKFTLKAGASPVIYNNKTSACYSWQFTYFGSGISAATVTVLTAPDAGNTPGTFATFTPTTGSNPATATTQSTALLTGSYAWIKIAATLTGTGQISGRLLGAQATSATTGFGSGGAPWGSYTAPNFADFTWVDQGTATVSQSTIAPNGTIMVIPQGGNSDTRRKLCTTLHAPPFTVEVGFINDKIPNQFQSTGFTLRNSGTGKEELFQYSPSFIGNVAPWSVYQCSSNLSASCSDVASGFAFPLTAAWTYGRVVDNGIIRAYDVSLDGVNYWRSTSRFGSDDPGPVYGFSTYDQVCMHVWLNTNSGPWHGRFFHWRVT